MKVRELAKKNRGEGVRYSFKLYPGAQLEMNPYSILHIFLLLFNEYCRRSPRHSPLSAAKRKNHRAIARPYNKANTVGIDQSGT